LSLAAGQSSLFTITFKPQASGTASANASFASNASNSSVLESLTGSGTPPPLHSVDLSWVPSLSVVVGYNVFRGTKSGGPYTKITPVLEAGSAYTDNAIQAGLTYYYVTTSVDASGVESGYSNEVQALIPNP
jgi:fibronectin type 3 domain-containing protein